MKDREMLKEVAKQLDKWAEESLQGGWSTHQVKPMIALADKIYAYIMRSRGI